MTPLAAQAMEVGANGETEMTADAPEKGQEEEEEAKKDKTPKEEYVAPGIDIDGDSKYAPPGIGKGRREITIH